MVLRIWISSLNYDLKIKDGRVKELESELSDKKLSKLNNSKIDNAAFNGINIVDFTSRVNKARQKGDEGIKKN